MSLRERVYDNLVKRRNRILEGKINCIPSSFTRFKDDFIGIEQSTYYCISSFTKGGKSQFTSPFNILFLLSNKEVVILSLKLIRMS